MNNGYLVKFHNDVTGEDVPVMGVQEEDRAAVLYPYDPGTGLRAGWADKYSESEVVAEAAKWECTVKDEDDGKFGVYEKDGNIWVATFNTKESAEAFAKQYPSLKSKYLKTAKDAVSETEPATEAGTEAADEAALDKEIDEALEEIYK